ncbi:MAG: hypothetical protein E7168_04780 [Firmicutes bacterium]|nr:hypothetical protein [Bacillota bacterium]
MFQRKGNGHGFFCRCDMCRIKRKSSIWYMGCLLSLLVILIYQCIFSIFIVSRFNAFLCLFFLMLVICGFIRIIF